MAVLLAYLKVPLTWGDVFKRTFKEAFWEDNCLGMAAQLAYYFFFALFPALLFVLAVASYFPIEALVDDVFRNLGGFVPPEALSIITDQLTKISQGEQGGLLTIGVLAALWSSSAAMTAIIDTLNAAYDIPEGRPWWKVRMIAITLTIGVAIFILIAFTLILAGPSDRGNHRGAHVAWIRVRLDVEDPAMADRLRPGERRHRDHLLLRARCRARVGVAHARLHVRHRHVVGGVARLQVLRGQHGRVHRDLRRHRRRNGTDALVLHLRSRDPARCRDERGDRTRFALWQGRGGEGAGPEAEDRPCPDARVDGEAPCARRKAAKRQRGQGCGRPNPRRQGTGRTDTEKEMARLSALRQLLPKRQD